MIIAYLRPEATFSHEATLDLTKSLVAHSYSLKPVATIDNLFEELQQGVVQQIVVPFHNTLYGEYSSTRKGLDKYNPLIIAEKLLKIDLYIAIHPGAVKENINKILSKDSALGECARYLDKHFPSASRICMNSTAAAAAHISSQNLLFSAAVASKLAMDMYKLTIIGQKVQDNGNNYTTFLYLAKKLA